MHLHLLMINQRFLFFTYLKKSETVMATERFLAIIVSFGTVKHLWTESGVEYVSSGLKIKQEYSAPHSPHQNGTVERS